MKRVRASDLGLLLTIIVGLGAVVALARCNDAAKPKTNTAVEEEKLYLTASTARRLSLSFNGLAADWYWMRSLQYVGRKIINLPENVQLDDLSQLDLKLLAPLLDVATTLDPKFMEPYQYAAVVLPAIDVNESIRIVKKGIAANPNSWRLYHHLGFIYWQLKDYKSATDAYTFGAQLPGAPPWMQVMKARMINEAGSRNTAREVYRRMYEDAGDDQVKEMARRRLLQLDAFDEMDTLRRLMAAYQRKTGRCPDAWTDLAAVFRSLNIRVDATGAPFDPAGTPYLLQRGKCDVEIDWHSQVPIK